MKDDVTTRRHFLVPEIIQSSAMDCGPAALKAVLDGYSLATSYGRLREACQTDVDGTSIDALEELANQLGLCADQEMLPLDHLPLPQTAALPALVVARLPQGDTHFVVLWRRLGPWVLVMDPGVGRRLMPWARLQQELYIHTTRIPAAAWRQWAGSVGFQAPLAQRLCRLGIRPARFLAEANADKGPHRLAHLDAATRMLAALRQANGVAPGPEAARLLSELLGATVADADAGLPAEFYSARPLPRTTEDAEDMLELRGAVLLRIRGRRVAAAPGDTPAPTLPDALQGSPEDEARSPLRGLWQHAGAGQGKTAAALIAGALLVATGGVLEAGLFRGLLDWLPRLGWLPDRLLVLGAVLAVCLGLWALERALYTTALALGRQVELGLRAALHAKLPRLGDHYLHSRPISDMAERGHQLYRVREVPLLLLQAVRTAGQLLSTTAALLWSAPQSAPLVVLLALSTLVVPLLLQPLLVERDLRARSHQGALMRFHLDTLQGAVPLRAHAAEPALGCEYEGLLSEWGRSRLALGRAVLLLTGGQGGLALIGVAALWLSYVTQHREPSTVLLLLYWSLSMPLVGHSLTLLLRQYPAVRSSLVRLLEPLHCAQEPASETDRLAPPPTAGRGVAIALDDVQVCVAGRPLLGAVSLDIVAGSQVAIVGSSGAGKSTLVGLLLGFYRPSAGRLAVDGEELAGDALQRLREATAWVDPGVQLFNRSLVDNLRYGGPEDALPTQELLLAASLLPLLARLPAGLQTPLGEGGALVSGGEGQRVRLGRALLRRPPRLWLLDEPFRGLPRPERRQLLQRLRQRCHGATLLCVTHDVSETLAFERVLVVDSGGIVEDGAPAALLARADSRYAALLRAEQEAARTVWGSAAWRRLQLVQGKLVPASPAEGEHDLGNS